MADLAKDKATLNAEKAVDEIIYDIMDRRGLKYEWNGIDKEVQAEIKLSWVKIITDCMK